MSWFFNNHLMLLHELRPNDDPLTINLNQAVLWVQIHDLPSRLMLKALARWFRYFLGEFIEYDTKIPSLGIQWYMRITVWLDVSLALKRKRRFRWERKCTMPGFSMKSLVYFVSFVESLAMGKVLSDETSCRYE